MDPRTDAAAADRDARQSRAIFRALGDRWGQLQATEWLGAAGDLAQARELLERGLHLAASQNYQPGQVFAELGLGQVARREGNLEAAEAHIRNVLRISERTGGEPDVARAISLSELGFIAGQRGDEAEARSWHRQALTAARELGDQQAVAQALFLEDGQQGASGAGRPA
jgi:tetratricopeptide (TPR) repeat protein